MIKYVARKMLSSDKLLNNVQVCNNKIGVHVQIVINSVEYDKIITKNKSKKKTSTE